MITEEQIDLLIERLIRRTEMQNTYFLTEIGSSIKKIRELTPTEARQLVQILKYGGNYDDIIKELERYTNLNVEDLDRIISEYAKKDAFFYKEFYEYRNLPFTPFEKNSEILRQTNLLKQLAKQEVYNFSRSNVLGYTIRDLDNKVQFYGLKDTYNRVLDEALLNVGQGKETFDSAMGRLMEEIGGSGLKTIEYESGRSMRLDSALRMHLKGRLMELHNENQKIIGDIIETDGVEISVHTNPAPDHAEAQGRQFTNEEYEKLQGGLPAKVYNSKKIVSLDDDGKNGYRPISEMNCYHYMFTVVLGVKKPEYSDEELQQIIDEGKEKHEFDGKKYTKYEGMQLQRQLERRIRQQKDIQMLAKTSNNQKLVDKAEKKITQLTKKYSDLSNELKLPTKLERLKVAGFKRTKKV